MGFLTELCINCKEVPALMHIEKELQSVNG